MKKLLCGILAVVSILALLTACGEMENVTTTTTTQVSTTDPSYAARLNELNEYIGYWYVDQSSVDFDKSQPDYYANINMIYISDVWEKNGDIYVSLTTYLSDMEDVYKELCPWEYHAVIGLNSASNSLRAGVYDVELKGGKVIIDSGEIVFTHKISSDAHYNELMEYNEQVVKNRYAGYWYMYGLLNGEKPEICELYIKDVDGFYITFDFMWGDYHGENITTSIKNGMGRFELGDGSTGLLNFKYRDYIVFEILKNDEYTYIGQFVDRSQTRFTWEEKNSNLSDYVGYWYTQDVSEESVNDPGIGYSEIYIKEIKGNKITFGYHIAGVTGDIVAGEIKNNVCVFDTKYMGEPGGKGIIRFENDGVYLEVRPSADAQGGPAKKYPYQRSYSLRRDEWVF